MSRIGELKAAKSLRNVADLLGLSTQTLSYILYKLPPDTKYKTFSIPKRGGGERTINAPTANLIRLQRALADLMQDCVDELAREKRRFDHVSHGFTRKRSIVSNARMHRGQRWVLNLDLQDFFPSINFGRVRGFLIKNADFSLDPYVATLIAQIACYGPGLPQGSPCSPVLANLVAHILDMRLVKLASGLKCRYSRYADDLTFSTNKLDFPRELAIRESDDRGTPAQAWTVGDVLRGIIERCDFLINDKKTNMMYRSSRQEVTGLVVNRTIRAPYTYRHNLRAMVDRLVRTGEFEIFGIVHKDGSSVVEKRLGTTRQLHGMLGFSDFISNGTKPEGPVPFSKGSSSDERTYRKFLLYSMFYASDQPVILSEGNTDNIYLTCALKRLANNFPDLAHIVDGKLRRIVKLFKFRDSSTGRLLNLHKGGSDVLKRFIIDYKKETEGFGPGLRQPVIILFDNDDGATEICKVLRNLTKRPLPHEFPFIRVIKNVYAVPTPGEGSKIEDLFDEQTKATIIRGKSFDATNDFETEQSYGKMIFAREVVAAGYEDMDFSGFQPLLQNLVAAIRDYRSRVDPD